MYRLVIILFMCVAFFSCQPPGQNSSTLQWYKYVQQLQVRDTLKVNSSYCTVRTKVGGITIYEVKYRPSEYLTAFLKREIIVESTSNVIIRMTEE